MKKKEEGFKEIIVESENKESRFIHVFLTTGKESHFLIEIPFDKDEDVFIFKEYEGD